jgi:putative drug exporter of the RND superfamily
MLGSIATLCVRAPGRVLAAALLFVVVTAIFGGSAVAKLTGGGFEDPHAESTRAAQLLADRFAAGPPNFLLLATVPDQLSNVDDPAARTAGERLARDLAAQDGVSNVQSYWTSGRPPALRSGDGRRALVAAYIG